MVCSSTHTQKKELGHRENGIGNQNRESDKVHKLNANRKHEENRAREWETHRHWEKEKEIATKTKTANTAN